MLMSLPVYTAFVYAYVYACVVRVNQALTTTLVNFTAVNTRIELVNESNRGYYMAARRYEISLRVLRNMRTSE